MASPTHCPPRQTQVEMGVWHGTRHCTTGGRGVVRGRQAPQHPPVVGA